MANQSTALPAADIELLKINSVLSITGLSRTALYQRIKDGTFIPPVKVGRNNVWGRHEISQWVKASLSGCSSSELKAVCSMIAAAR